MSTDPTIIDSLLQVMRLMRRHFDECVREMGLTMSRARVIVELARHDGMSQNDLARVMMIEPPTLKRQIDALEADGFVECRPAEDDGRKKVIFLSEKGRQSKVNEFSQSLRDDVLQDIDAADLATARQVLDQIAANIRKLADR
ncbi:MULTISPECIES: MarR family winged helix-turn-helix transcriptional regulator [Paracoccus]|uniref:MarR family transcriptional regulator n=1 Tax=Paracoccus onubensis TaxID=1675788 RepID=A0A418SNH3_9RHOB|nr:MarR family transcriptional regulator [Paracoccus onubensis]MDP0929171.1 MarR family transcriptional regulator [Paracoccus onubensis]RJE82495.1 MarR family transcriptional regulator [Paracoccus onubensis]